MFKEHYQNRYVSTSLAKTKNDYFLLGINWSKSRVMTGPSLGSKKGQLGQINNYLKYASQIFWY